MSQPAASSSGIRLICMLDDRLIHLANLETVRFEMELQQYDPKAPDQIVCACLHPIHMRRQPAKFPIRSILLSSEKSIIISNWVFFACSYVVNLWSKIADGEGKIHPSSEPSCSFLNLHSALLSQLKKLRISNQFPGAHCRNTEVNTS